MELLKGGKTRKPKQVLLHEFAWRLNYNSSNECDCYSMKSGYFHCYKTKGDSEIADL